MSGGEDEKATGRGRPQCDHGWGNRRSGVIRRPPVVRQQQLEVAVLQHGQARELVFETGPEIVPVEFFRLDQSGRW